MNPSLVTASALFAPFGRFLRNLHGLSESNKPSVQPAPRLVATSGAVQLAPARRTGTSAAAKTGTHHRRQPLRVVRVMEAGQASTLTGRILMSGRMADVCAELDRMVERESACRSTA